MLCCRILRQPLMLDGIKEDPKGIPERKAAWRPDSGLAGLSASGVDFWLLW